LLICFIQAPKESFLLLVFGHCGCTQVGCFNDAELFASVPRRQGQRMYSGGDLEVLKGTRYACYLQIESQNLIKWTHLPKSFSVLPCACCVPATRPDPV